MLQGTLLIGYGLLQLPLGQIVSGRLHRLGSFFELRHKARDIVVAANQFARTGALDEASRLLGKCPLQVSEQGGVVLDTRLILSAILDCTRQIERRHQDFALPVRDAAFLVATATTATTTAGGLRLRIAPVKRLHLNQEQIGLHRGMVITSNGVITDDITGL